MATKKTFRHSPEATAQLTRLAAKRGDPFELLKLYVGWQAFLLPLAMGVAYGTLAPLYGIKLVLPASICVGVMLYYAVMETRTKYVPVYYVTMGLQWGLLLTAVLVAVFLLLIDKSSERQLFSAWLLLPTIGGLAAATFLKIFTVVEIEDTIAQMNSHQTTEG